MLFMTFVLKLINNQFSEIKINHMDHCALKCFDVSTYGSALVTCNNYCPNFFFKYHFPEVNLFQIP